ncbi:MAG: hypothetical protein WBG10_05680 [Pseudolabrys sp.]
MRRSILVISGLCVLWLPTPAQATSMKSTAPERMLQQNDAKKMRACDDRAMREKIPMEQKSAFVKKCMAEMK